MCQFPNNLSIKQRMWLEFLWNFWTLCSSVGHSLGQIDRRRERAEIGDDGGAFQAPYRVFHSTPFRRVQSKSSFAISWHFKVPFTSYTVNFSKCSFGQVLIFKVYTFDGCLVRFIVLFCFVLFPDGILACPKYFFLRLTSSLIISALLSICICVLLRTFSAKHQRICTIVEILIIGIRIASNKAVHQRIVVLLVFVCLRALSPWFIMKICDEHQLLNKCLCGKKAMCVFTFVQCTMYMEEQ